MIPPTMTAALLTGHGGLDRLSLRDDVPTPVPAPEEVLVRVGAAGINNTDINLRVGWYSKAADSDPSATAADAGWTGASLAFPRIQGADACGRIVAVGAAVPATRIGERVLVNPVLHGDGSEAPRYLGSDCDGAFAGFVRVPAANAVRIESALSDVELASFPCAYLAAENMLARAGVGPTDTVVVTGASGGVGSAAVQLARRRGARVVAIAGAAKAAEVASLGAERVIARDQDLIAALGRGSASVVIDVVGGRQFGVLLELLARRGRYAVAGAIAGAEVALDLRTLYLKDLTLAGCTIPAPGLFETLVTYIERGEIRPLVSRTYPLRQIAVAQAEFLGKAHVGKIVLLAG
jgi:NADPH:quinone reductase-like Zn-dependent oxidoreductase